MKPVTTPRQHEVEYVGAPGSDVYPLPSFVDEFDAVCSVWELTDAERAAIAEGGRVLLAVEQTPPPPVGLRVVGPWCEKHQHEQTWIAQLETWGCPEDDDDHPDGV